MGDTLIETKSAELTVHQVNPAFIHTIWPQVNYMLLRGLEHSQNEYGVDYLKMLIIQGQQILLVAEEDGKIYGAATVQFENYPNERIAFMTCIGGRMIATQDCWKQFCDWAKANGASRVRGWAHPSVARLWHQRFGVESTYIVVDKKL